MPEVPVPLPPPSIESSTPSASPEAPHAPDVVSGAESKTAQMLSKIREKMGRQVDTGDILRSMSEGVDKGRWKSKDWKRAVTRRHLVHRTLRPDAKAWYRGHKEDIDAAYQKQTEGKSDLTAKDKMREWATAINDHREATGATLKSEIDGAKGESYQKALQSRIDALTSQKGRALTVRERVREERGALIDTISQKRNEAQIEKTAQAQVQIDRDSSVAAKNEAMSRDPQYQKTISELFSEKGYHPDSVTQEQLDEMQIDAADRYRQQKKNSSELLNQRAIKDKSYTDAFLELTRQGIPLEDAKTQALDIARRKVEEDDVRSASTQAEADAATARLEQDSSSTAEHKAMLRDPLFKDKKSEVFRRMGLHPNSVSKEQLKLVEDQAVKEYVIEKDAKDTERDEKALNDESYTDAFLELTGQGTPIEDAKTQALDIARRKVDKDYAKAQDEKRAGEVRDTEARARGKQAEERDKQRIVNQADFEPFLNKEVDGLGNNPSASEIMAARERAIKAYKKHEADTRVTNLRTARDKGIYSQTYTELLSGLDSLDDDSVAAFQQRVEDAAIAKVKALPETSVAASGGEKEVEQTPEDFLKGLNLPIDAEPGKGLLEIMRTDPESAKAVIAKIQEAKTNVAKLLEDAQGMGVTFDSEASLKQALGKIGSDFIDTLNTDATDGRTLPQRAKIKSLLKAVLAAVGVLVVGAGVAAVSGAVKISNPGK